MPPGLTAVLAALGAEAGPDEFAAVESLLGGSLSGLAGLRRNPVARVDAAGLTCLEVGQWLSGLPAGPGAELHVAWAAERLGARMSFEVFTANLGDLWFPAMDDVIAVFRAGGQVMILVLDHEEVVTLSRRAQI